MTEEYDAVLAGLQRRGFRLELSADDESVVRVTSPGGNTLDQPSWKSAAGPDGGEVEVLVYPPGKAEAEAHAAPVPRERGAK